MALGSEVLGGGAGVGRWVVEERGEGELEEVEVGGIAFAFAEAMWLVLITVQAPQRVTDRWILSRMFQMVRPFACI